MTTSGPVLVPSLLAPAKAPVQQRVTHQSLLARAQLTPVACRARMDAIVVPAGREASHLDPAIALAAQTDSLLVLLCSRKANPDQVLARVSRIKGVKALVIDVPPDHTLDDIPLLTGTDHEIVEAQAGRDTDLSLKRNLGLLLARVRGWERILFLDDDIRDLKPFDVFRLAGSLDQHGVGSMLTRDFPDNSVVCHASRLSGGVQDVFASGSVLAVRTDQPDLPFFPDVYNEDWFFFAEHAANRDLAHVGHSRQLRYDPFIRRGRAAEEEFGDVLAEGLYLLLEAGKGRWAGRAAFWDDFIVARKQFISTVSERLLDVATPEAWRALASLEAAHQQHGVMSSYLCAKFVELWREDKETWQQSLQSLPRLNSISDALDHLRLESFATVGLPLRA